MHKRILRSSIAAAGILVLILDSQTALTGARDGIELCLSSVIPSVFPFLVLSGMLLNGICGSTLPILRPLGRILGIPIGSEAIFVTGILGGYPTGAQAVYNAWKQGQLSKAEAQRMLAFCSNAGPSFLFGILGSKFPCGWMLWVLWLIHIVSAISVGIIQPGRSREQRSIPPSSPLTLTQSLKRSVAAMGSICGWVVLFRLILAFLDRWLLWLLPASVQVGIHGLLELANGCSVLDSIPSVGVRFILCSGMLAFGGICVAMQTSSVTGALGMGCYVRGKVLQMLISIVLSSVLQLLMFPETDKAVIPAYFFFLLGACILAIAFIPAKNKIRGRNLSAIGV